MSLYGTKPYSTFLYGPDTSTIASISPDTGPSTGGQSFVLTGTDFDPRHWDDTFELGALSALWTDSSVGTGTVTTGASHLQLSTGATAASYARIGSVNTWTDCQLEVRAILPRAARSAGTVVPLAFQLRVDVNNYAVMYINLLAAGTYTINCDVYRAGVSVGSYSATCTRGLSNLRILRWGTTVYFIYNGALIYYNSGFVSTAATARIYAFNNAIAYDATSTVEWFYWRSFVVIGDQLVYAPTVVSNWRLRGFTPPSADEKGVVAAYAGLRDVSVVAVGTATYAASYEYYFEDRLRVLNIPQFDMLLSVIDDNQLITKSTMAKGL